MRFVFWQGIISIHQKPFLEALAKQPSVDKILLVVEHDITPYRKNMGWNVPEINGVEVRVAPSKAEIQSMAAMYNDAIHIMGGIRVGEMLTIAFDECIKYKCRLGIMTEPYNDAGLKGVLRSVKYRHYSKKYFKHIQFVLAIGRQGVAQYTDLGFNKDGIFPWAYFISVNVASRKDKDDTEKRIIYAGRLEEAKGIYRFAEELSKAENKDYIFDIYGTGADEMKLKKLVADKGLEGRIRIFPFIEHAAMLRKYAEYNWVVLPSAGKDGWGAIVSEGLLNGLKAICSNICGVSWVIKDGFNGVVFNWAQPDSCGNAIGRMLGDEGFAYATSISEWADDRISGHAGARYFMEIVNNIYGSGKRPPIPWEV